MILEVGEDVAGGDPGLSAEGGEFHKFLGEETEGGGTVKVPEEGGMKFGRLEEVGGGPTGVGKRLFRLAHVEISNLHDRKWRRQASPLRN